MDKRVHKSDRVGDLLIDPRLTVARVDGRYDHDDGISYVIAEYGHDGHAQENDDNISEGGYPGQRIGHVYVSKITIGIDHAQNDKGDDDADEGADEPDDHGYEIGDGGVYLV